MYYDTDHAGTSAMTPDDTSLKQNDVQGWLLGVHGYRENARDAVQNNRPQASPSIAMPTIRQVRKERPESISSISSEDSVNLEALISTHFTADMDQETDLSALAELDLDDSNENFWNMDDVLVPFRPSTTLSNLTDPKPPRSLLEPTSSKGSLVKNKSQYQHHAFGTLDKYGVDDGFEDFLNLRSKVSVHVSLPSLILLSRVMVNWMILIGVQRVKNSYLLFPHHV
ncbi:hypothetical protein BDF14DRAFT_1388713 [Spinellus fusiger]|nr:hypothetical protein BDF14DRAFT_1388713 [Spinellus fusiger]